MLPAAWNDAPWWSDARSTTCTPSSTRSSARYNVDENRVVLVGRFRRRNGAYYVAMRDTTPYAAFLPLNGYILVLQHAVFNGGTDLFPANLREQAAVCRERRSRSALSDGRRRADTASSCRSRRCDHISAATRGRTRHDLVAQGEGRLRSLRARPPARAAAGSPDLGNIRPTQIRPRALAADRRARLDGRRCRAISPTRMSIRRAPAAELGFRLRTGSEVDRVIKDTMASRLGLERNDVIQQVGSIRFTSLATWSARCRPIQTASPIRMTVSRGGPSIELSGTFDPIMVQAVRRADVPALRKSGRVDLVRTRNTIDARTSRRHAVHAAVFTGSVRLRISRSRWSSTAERRSRAASRRALPTLMKWAARDNDRTMLFAAEIPIHMP